MKENKELPVTYKAPQTTPGASELGTVIMNLLTAGMWKMSLGFVAPSALLALEAHQGLCSMTTAFFLICAGFNANTYIQKTFQKSQPQIEEAKKTIPQASLKQ